MILTDCAFIPRGSRFAPRTVLPAGGRLIVPRDTSVRRECCRLARYIPRQRRVGIAPSTPLAEAGHSLFEESLGNMRSEISAGRRRR